MWALEQEASNEGPSGLLPPELPSWTVDGEYPHAPGAQGAATAEGETALKRRSSS